MTEINNFKGNKQLQYNRLHKQFKFLNLRNYFSDKVLFLHSLATILKSTFKGLEELQQEEFQNRMKTKTI